MPAFYAHDRFGEKVWKKTDGEIREIILKHYKQFEIGLQGPDIFFFYRPYSKNKVVKYGNRLHSVSARAFFERAVKAAERAGRDSAQYAYLLGFICHFILDSECHPYVAEMIEETGVQHLEIEEEFEKYLLKRDGLHPLAYRLGRLVPTDVYTAKAIAPFYPGISWQVARSSLRWLRFIKNLLRAPGRVKQGLINTIMKMRGRYAYSKGLMHQRVDNPKCAGSNQGLYRRFTQAIEIAVEMIESFDESVREGRELNLRFDRTFE